MSSLKPPTDQLESSMTKRLKRDPKSERKRPPQRVFSPAVMDNSNLSDAVAKVGEKYPVGGTRVQKKKKKYNNKMEFEAMHARRTQRRAKPHCFEEFRQDALNTPPFERPPTPMPKRTTKMAGHPSNVRSRLPLESIDAILPQKTTAQVAEIPVPEPIEQEMQPRLKRRASVQVGGATKKRRLLPWEERLLWKGQNVVDSAGVRHIEASNLPEEFHDEANIEVKEVKLERKLFA